MSPESADLRPPAQTIATVSDWPAEPSGPEAGSKPKPAPGLGYWDLLYLVLFAIVSLIVLSVAAYLGLGFFLGWDVDLEQASSRTKAAFAIIFQGLSSVLVLAFIYALITVKHELPFGHAIGWRPIEYRPLFYGAAYSAAGAALAFSVALASRVIPMPDEPTPFQDLLGDPSAVLIVAIFAVAIAPVFEETIFRGFVFSIFERAHGKLAAVVITAGSFSLIHGPQYGWHWQILVLLLYVGIVFGAVRAKTRSIVPPAIVHTAYNMTLVMGVLSAGQASGGV